MAIMPFFALAGNLLAPRPRVSCYELPCLTNLDLFISGSGLVSDQRDAAALLKAMATVSHHYH